ncbi:MAG TPA: hypothetical protein VF230_12550 [Acidimicrobiales bacterium]
MPARRQVSTSARPLVRVRAVVAALVSLVGMGAAACGRGQSPAIEGAAGGRLEAAAATTTTEPPTTTTEPPTTTTAAPTTTIPPTTAPPTTARPTTTAPPAAAARPGLPSIVAEPARRPAAGSIEPYRGLGTWVDVYDWSHYKGSTPSVGPDQVDQMAAAGVQTLFLQTAKHDTPQEISEPELLLPIIDRAHHHGIEVVAWYLPTLEDPANDLRRLVASANLDVDGIAVDIEARNVSDVNERNRRLIELSAQLRQALPNRALGGIVLPPVVLEVVNGNYWPNFPWREIAPYYDVWQTMGYWTNRTQSSGYRDAYRYTDENIRRMRNNLGQPDAVVHPVGGIGDKTTDADIDGYLRAVAEHRGIGGSLYDWRTTHPSAWDRLRQLRI